jgi:2'-5' RNA ligase
MDSYYVGIQIEEAEGAHVTVAFLGKKTNEEITEVIAVVEDCLGQTQLGGVPIVLDQEDMFGPNKDLRVRICHFDTSTKCGQTIKDLAVNLYDRFAKKDYPQNLHITATKVTAENDVIFKSNNVTGCKIYVKKLGTSDYIYNKNLKE